MNLDINIVEYLEKRLPGHFEEDDRGWLIGRCLWHDDGKRPNLGIFGETGSYRCLSCGAHGDMIKLVQKVEKLPSYGAAEDWLDEHYGIDSDNETISFELSLGKKPKKRQAADWQPPSEDIFELYRLRHPYLEEERGISNEIQKQFEIGYRKGAITLPWRDRRGALITVKFRSTFDKRFWYSPRVPQGKRATMLYGLHEVVRTQAKTVWITEAEIDCLSLWQSGRPAVALGGSDMSAEQARELAYAGVSKVIMACDRDSAGRKAHSSIVKQLSKYGIPAIESVWPDVMIIDKDGKERPVKDINELLLAARIDELTYTDGNLLSLTWARS